MKCFVCDAGPETWRKVSILKDGKQVPIHSESTIQICQGCGNAVHNVEPEAEEKIKQFYRKDYRPQPTILNLITTTHKQNYVQVFLRDFLKGKKDLLVGDVGAATGYLLNFFRGLGHKVAGSELTITYRRMSEHYYGIPLTEELEPKHKYDLICMYHVLEHLVEPDKKLAYYASLLNEGGHILVATPEWFDVVEEASGPPVSTFEHLFHKNHINLFSRNSIQNLFRKCGLTVVKDDFLQYGQTYLLKKSESPRLDSWLSKDDWHEVERVMHLQYRAIELHSAGKFREAYRLYPRFPDAWLGMIFTRCGKDLAKQNDLFAEADKIVGDTMKYILAKGQWYYQQGKMDEAINVFKAVLSLKPNEDTFMIMGYAYAQIGRVSEAIASFQTAARMDPRKWTESNQWILNTVSRMPAWDESAKEEIVKAGLVGAEVG